LLVCVKAPPPAMPSCRRKLDDPRAAKFAALPGVELFAGDLANEAEVASSLVGVTRALFVSSAFSFDQFETETLFIEAAARAGLEVTVRVSTASGLIKTRHEKARTAALTTASLRSSRRAATRLSTSAPIGSFRTGLETLVKPRRLARSRWPVERKARDLTVIDPRDVRDCLG